MMVPSSGGNRAPRVVWPEDGALQGGPIGPNKGPKSRRAEDEATARAQQGRLLRNQN